MQTSSNTDARLIRDAAARLHRAAGLFLEPPVTGELEMGEFRCAELTAAARLTLDMLENAPEPVAAADRQHRVVAAIRALEQLELRELDALERQALSAVVGGWHCDLRRLHDDDVTRTLLDATAAGPALAELVFDIDPQTLDPDAQVSYCQAVQRLESAVHARLGVGLVAFAGSNPRHTPCWVEGDEFTLADVRASELASALAWSGGKAREALESARIINSELDDARAAAADGTLQPGAVSVIAEGAHSLTVSLDREIESARAAMHLDTDGREDLSQRVWDLTATREELVQRFDSTLTAFASTHTVAETRRKVRDTLAKLDPQGFQSRRDEAKSTQSTVQLRPLPDAMAMLTAVMPAEHATACFRAIDAVAQQLPSQDLVGERRTNALLALCARSAGGHAEEAPAARLATSAHVDLVMSLDAFLGVSDTPAECVGAGPIPAAAAREFLAAAELVSIRRVLVDDRTGHALDVGVRRYALTDGERRYIFARDRSCRHPGCNQPAHRCECDHAIPYDEGGDTRTGNLGALCVRHHLEKTHGGWSIRESAADGSCTFVSPLGREYRHEAEALLPWADFGTVPDRDARDRIASDTSPGL